MPLEGSAKPATVNQRRSVDPLRLSSLLEDGDIGAATADAPFRMRLHSLFAQIEKEFESLHMRNVGLQEKLDLVNRETTGESQHPSANTAGVQQHPPNKTDAAAEASTTNLIHPYHRYVAPEYFDTVELSNPMTAAAATAVASAAISANKALRSKQLLQQQQQQQQLQQQQAATAAASTSSHSTSKIKASHKLRAQTSRIVSSFKGQSVISSVVREYVGHKDGVWAVTVKQGQPLIGTASADHVAAVWAIESGRCLLQYHGHSGSVNTIKFHTNKDVVLTASGDGTAHIWQAAVQWEREAATSGGGGGALGGAGGGRQRGHSSEEELEDGDEDLLMMDDELDNGGGGGRGDRVDVLRTPLAEFGSGPGGHGSSPVIAADWLPGGDQIITASWDRTAILWDVETKEMLQPLAGHDDELTYAAAHPSQRLVVTSSRDSTFRLWDFRDQIPAVSVFQGHTESVTSTVFARDDKVVSGSDDRTVKVWELRNMRSALATIRTDASINKLAVSQSGVIGIPHDNRHIRLYDLNGQRVTRLPRSNRLGHQRMASSVAWSEDPSYHCNLFSAGFDRRVLGWSICLPKENQ